LDKLKAVPIAFEKCLCKQNAGIVIAKPVHRLFVTGIHLQICTIQQNKPAQAIRPILVKSRGALFPQSVEIPFVDIHRNASISFSLMP
jgi:hypothetical protein